MACEAAERRFVRSSTLAGNRAACRFRDEEGFVFDQGPAVQRRQNGFMGEFIFTCPTTGLNVQAWTGTESADPNSYEAIHCNACKRVHLVSPSTGRVAGEGGSVPLAWRKDD